VVAGTACDVLGVFASSPDPPEDQRQEQKRHPLTYDYLVSGAGNCVSKLHAGSCRLAWSSEREVSEASIRGATCVAHGVPSNGAGEDIHNQSSSMALTLHDLIRATFAVSSRLLIAARGRIDCISRAVSALERFS
jgi:hypothetical protein